MSIIYLFLETIPPPRSHRQRTRAEDYFARPVPPALCGLPPGRADSIRSASAFGPAHSDRMAGRSRDDALDSGGPACAPSMRIDSDPTAWPALARQYRRITGDLGESRLPPSAHTRFTAARRAVDRTSSESPTTDERSRKALGAALLGRTQTNPDTARPVELAHSTSSGNRASHGPPISVSDGLRPTTHRREHSRPGQTTATARDDNAANWRGAAPDR